MAKNAPPGLSRRRHVEKNSAAHATCSCRKDANAGGDHVRFLHVRSYCGDSRAVAVTRIEGIPERAVRQRRNHLCDTTGHGCPGPKVERGPNLLEVDLVVARVLFATHI